MKAYAKENFIQKPPLKNVKINGYVHDLMNVFFENRIFSDFAKNVVLKEATDAFRNCEDEKGLIGLWQGEFWGKWVLSATRVCQYTGDDDLKNFLHKSALELIGFQRENGYIGTYQDSKHFYCKDPEEAIRQGWPGDWNWNIWCRKYTLWALLECYLLTDDNKILNSCIKIADNLLEELAESGKRLRETGAFKGFPSCSILKPMLLLYRITQEEKYLALCLDFVKDWEDSDLIPALIANCLSKKPFSQWYDFNLRWAKAYEMMSCFDGLLELYRVTANETYLKTCECFYEIAIENELNALYSVAFNDEFRDAKFNINAITEPCDVIHWMRLCHELFSLTGDAKYMDSFELAFYNPFLASSYKDGRWGARGARGHGRHLAAEGQAGLEHNHCCVNNMPRGYMNMAETIAMTSKDAIYINLYSEAEIALENGTSIRIDGNYLADSRANIVVEFKDTPLCDIKLRIPAWSKTSTIMADGKTYNPKNGYFTLSPRNSRTEITVQFDNTLTIIPLSAHKELPDDPWKLRRWVSATMGECTAEIFLYDDRCTLQKGCVLLCRTKLIGNTEEEMFSGKNLISPSFEATYQKVTPKMDVQMQFDVTFQKDEKTFSAQVCDFASGTNIDVDDMKYFSIYF